MRYFTLLVLLALCFASCKKDEVDAKQTTSNIPSVETIVTGVNGPTTGLVNQELSYTLLWPNTSSQSYFHHLSASNLSDSTRRIKLFVISDTASIAKADRKQTAVFKFKASAAGTYYLKFAKPGNDTTYSIVDTVTIK